jgi:hypothetical protein
MGFPSSQPAPRLSDLARVHPADRTLQNLLGTLSAKLELCSRLPVFEYEATTEGHTEVAGVLAHLAALERQSFGDLLLCLRDHLDATIPDRHVSATVPVPERHS